MIRFCIASPSLIIKIFDIIRLNKTNPDQNFTSDKYVIQNIIWIMHWNHHRIHLKKKQDYELSNLALLYYKITLETLHTGLFYVIFHTSAQPHEIGGSSFCCSCNGRRWEEERLEHNGMKSFPREHFYSYQPAFLEGITSIFISWSVEMTQKLILLCKVFPLKLEIALRFISYYGMQL